jgi:rRNA maturation endonuclease Nob1
LVREKSKYYKFQEPTLVYVVADASVFIWGKRPEGELITVPAVEAELKDIQAKSRLFIFEARVESPTSQALKEARSAAAETGDLKVLSHADL